MNTQQQKVKGVVDLVFVLDATGSMEPCIDNLKANIQTFINSLTSKDVNNAAAVSNWRAKVVGYRDFVSDGPEAFQDNAFVDTAEALREQLSRLVATGGGDEPESLLEALYKIATTPSTERGEAPTSDRWRYRSDAHRAVIVFSDAPFKRELVDPSGANLADVLTALETARIILSVFAPDVPHYAELSELDKCEYNVVKGGATPQESLRLYTEDQKNFQETLRKLGRTLSQTVAVTPL